MTEQAIGYRKCLEGVKCTRDLLELLELSVAIISEGHHRDENDVAKDQEKQQVDTTTTTSTPEGIIRTNEPLVRVAEDSYRTLSKNEARLILLAIRTPPTKQDWIPVPVLRAMETVLDTTGKTRLDRALRDTTLVFTPPPTVDEKERTRQQNVYQKRIDRLRLAQEEAKYNKLTKNLGMTTGPGDDNITGKSMTYAASIGLNMIVAPLSFGCFMYFFAGGLLDYLGRGSQESTTTIRKHTALANSPDIRRVIAGVVSGVLMLFIEMILFVIRTHEMDQATRRKQKKEKHGAFSYYTSRSSRHYEER